MFGECCVYPTVYRLNLDTYRKLPKHRLVMLRIHSQRVESSWSSCFVLIFECRVCSLSMFNFVTKNYLVNQVALMSFVRLQCPFGIGFKCDFN